jgi:hypothetical protein
MESVLRIGLNGQQKLHKNLDFWLLSKNEEIWQCQGTFLPGIACRAAF